MHVALSFHSVREGIAAGITAPHWLKGTYNQSDVMIKQIAAKEFLIIVRTSFGQLLVEKINN